MSGWHDDLLRAPHGGRWLTPYMPLTIDEFRSQCSNQELLDKSDAEIINAWIRPVARRLQARFNIDPINYTSVPGSNEEGSDQVGSTIPTREQLDRDFATAIVIVIEKVALNPEDVTGTESVDGASRNFDHSIPNRAIDLLEPYRRPGRRGRIIRG